MTHGKQICKALKTIRKQVADANDIPYEVTECQHKGDCAGTCPRCEQEVRYIESQLQQRRRLGKAVAVVGISVGLAALTSCKSHKNVFVPEPLAGEVMYEPEPLRGKVPIPPAEQTSTGQEEQPEPTTLEEPKTMVVQSDTISQPMLVGDIVPQMPQFPGGQEALMQFLVDNVNYPEVARKKKIEGRVVVQFIVEKDGSIGEQKVLRSVHPVLDAEAMRVVNIMPKWVPGMIDGKPARVKYALPVTFKL